ncbi:flagellar assembly protein FliX [Methylobrevis pamukkalensis]|uniref:Flagellar assembly protein FliX n=1 Tax=Methylobrevis pamukkalensis TaxID=1439726 RepID=A0A1E3GZ39_9HYPH|nr:flagellar assembly protein FliX [Methylobrevis pamukkalensis]ODN69337.1 Flagellar assembly protein FliX [Methylobrevis pamukkalensis]
MRINGPNRPGSVSSPTGTKSSGSGATFAPTTADAPKPAATSSPAQSIGGLDALLALQAIASELPDRRKAVRRGHALLDVLDEVKIGLLDGGVPADALDRLVTLLAEREADPSEDEGLTALLDDIDLRARVELAKLGRYGD